MSFSDAIAQYRTCARAEGQSPKTVKETVACVRRFSQFLGGDPTLGDIGTGELRRFILALQKREAYAQHPYTRPQKRALSPETIATYVRSIKNFFAFLAREKIIPANLIAAVRVPRTPERIMPILTEAEIVSLLGETRVVGRMDTGYRDKALMLTLLDTGLRISELCGLRDSDVDLEGGVLKVMGKGQRERHVPIGAKVGKALGLYQWARPQAVGTDKFWLTEDGRPLTPGRIAKRLKHYAEKAGLKGAKVNPHSWRHTSAVFYLRNGGDIFTLQKKLGHKTLEMTRRYANLADSDVKAAHLSHSPADKLRG